MIREFGSLAGSSFSSASQLIRTVLSSLLQIHAQFGVEPRPWTATMLKKTLRGNKRTYVSLADLGLTLRLGLALRKGPLTQALPDTPPFRGFT